MVRIGLSADCKSEMLYVVTPEVVVTDTVPMLEVAAYAGMPVYAMLVEIVPEMLYVGSGVGEGEGANAA